MNSLRDWPVSVTSIIIKGLPGNTTEREVKSLLLFAGDLIQCGLRSSSPGGDKVTAWATFSSHEAALQAKTALDGKNGPQGVLTVELDKGSRPPIGARRNTTDGGLIGSQSNLYEKYTPHFPPGLQGPGLGDFSPSASIESGSVYSEQLYSSPQSPVQFGDTASLGYRLPESNISKALIAQDNNDDIVDAAGFLYSQDPASVSSLLGNSKPRRATNPQPTLSQFGNLTNYALASNGISQLNTNPLGTTQMTAGMMPTPVTSPIGPPPPNHANFLYRQNRMLPAVNPSDQNPPCNTLYVGNLPVGTSEDELKALFSRQRGYKRLCFRTKQNGPMCFVEFEDGGIRLSFSKNPLGVRSTPANGAAPIPGASQPYQQPYVNGPSGFSTAQHAPPGLIHPTAQHSGMPLYVGR
ncbi:hypothetical protein BDZ91DRAFT_428513 [Kalaharituber pfeilii]|nr:hypothetical protein BDZ91DRAFT_428513 [Kalaharituber pfeilii]